MINKLAKTLSKSDSSILNKQEVFNFNPQNNVILENTTQNFLYSLLSSYFKKFYCFISKPTFTVTSEKIIIHLLYSEVKNNINRRANSRRASRPFGERRAKYLRNSSRKDTNRKRFTLLRRLLAHKGMLNRSKVSIQSRVKNQTNRRTLSFPELTKNRLRAGRTIRNSVRMKLVKIFSSYGPYSLNKYENVSKDAETFVNTDKESIFNHKEYTETMFENRDKSSGRPSTFDRTIFGGQQVKKENARASDLIRRIRGQMLRSSGPSALLIKRKKVGITGRRQSSLFIPHLNNLIKLLSDILRTEVELEIVLLKYPYHDSNIFAQFLGFKAKKLTYGKIKNKIIKKIPVSLLKTKNKNFVSTPARYGGNKKSITSAGPLKFGVGLKGVPKKRAKLDLAVGSPSSKKNLGMSILKSKSILASILNVKKNSKIRGKKVTINLNARMSKRNKKKLIASNLTGIKVRIAGRLARQRVVPKRTVKTTYKGAISKSNNNLVDSATYTDKNKKGAFSIRVWLSHGIKN
jgi:Mitochondrial ribosomal protein (VAR1)